MTKVFIGGSRAIRSLDKEVTQRIDRMIEKRLPVAVGDANGVDKAVQQYLHVKRYDLVEVFCTGASPRNNVGNWPLRSVTPKSKRKDFAFYASKDRAMAEAATVGLMIWDEESVGTIMNVLRLVQQNKTAVVYVAPARSFVDLKSEADWRRFVGGLGVGLRDRVERERVAEVTVERVPAQASLV